VGRFPLERDSRKLAGKEAKPLASRQEGNLNFVTDKKSMEKETLQTEHHLVNKPVPPDLAYILK